VEEFLVSVAPPPRAEVEVLERRINDAFKQTSRRSRPSRVPVRRNFVRDRGRSRRHVRRTVRLVAHGPPGRPRPAAGDDEPPSPLASSRCPGLTLSGVRGVRAAG
jgi:hypothetical protein